MIRVLVADDQAIVRDGLVTLLGLLDDLEIVGRPPTAGSCQTPPSWCSPSMPTTPRSPARCFPQFTARERGVLTLIAEARSNAEIAAELFLGVSTVTSHVNAIFAKMPARDKAQAIALALDSTSDADL